MASTRSSPLCSRPGADPNAKDENERIPLHRAVSQHNAAVVTALLEVRADPNAKDERGQTPVHCAATYAYGEVLDALLRAGANPNVEDKHGQTPVHCVVRNGGWWQTAQSRNRTACLSALLGAEANPDVPDNKGLTPLHWAARRGLDAAVSALLRAWVEFGRHAWVDRNAKDCNGWTPLHWAVEKGSQARKSYRPQNLGNKPPLHLVALLNAGADPNAQNNGGETSLHAASRKNLEAEIRLLLAAGANPTLSANIGDTPASLEIGGGQRRCVAAAKEFRKAFKQEWGERIADPAGHERIARAYQGDGSWTGFMLGSKESPCGFLHAVGARLNRSVSKNWYTLDCVFYREEPNLIEWGTYPAGLDVIVEHENGGRVEEEMWKLLMWRAPLKC